MTWGRESGQCRSAGRTTAMVVQGHERNRNPTNHYADSLEKLTMSFLGCLGLDSPFQWPIETQDAPHASFTHTPTL